MEQFFDRVDEAADGRAENSRDACTTAGSHDHAPERHWRPQPARHLPGHRSPHLNRRTFGSKGKPAADGNDPRDQLHHSNP